MKIRPIVAGLALGAPLALAGPILAESHSSTLPSSDQQFLQKLAQEDQSEINLANLALQKSPNAQVKAYARKILSADPPMQSQALTVAQENKAKISATPAAAQHQEYATLAKLSGENFDHAYLKYEANKQEADLDMVQHEVNNTTDQQVKSFAQQEEPRVQAASTSARQLARSMGVNV